MSGWPGKYIIGLTGNIATGKSVVRRMLEHLGAFGIDADALAHRTFAPEAPGYHPLIQAFGRQILLPDGRVDRARLGALVFTDPQALRSLEAIVHPLVGQAAYNLISRAPQPVVVIEAIKLLESSLREHCDALWVTWASPETQLRRLQQQRGMSFALAQQRIAAQPPQEEKVAAADVLIRNEGDFFQVWQQIEAAWCFTFPGSASEGYTVETGQPDFSIQCALPQQAGQVADLVTRFSQDHSPATQEQIQAEMGSRSFWIFRQGENVLGAAGWRADHFIARLDPLYLDSRAEAQQSWVALPTGIDRAARDSQCEVSLVNLPQDLRPLITALQAAGYRAATGDHLPQASRQDAAGEVAQKSELFYKPLPQPGLFEAI
jgi:dephospho-CoA kinase